jgi:cytochrome-b5 reductase
MSPPLRFGSQVFRRHLSSSSLPSRPSRRVGVFTALTITCGASALAYFFYPSETRHAPTHTDGQLSPTHFTRTLVVSTEDTGPDTKLITVRLPPQSPEDLTLAPVWSVFIKDDDIQVERPYTPLSSLDQSGKIQFWVKKYKSGEVGRWLHNKVVGDQIELRGPLQTWPWQNDVWDDVVMVSLYGNSYNLMTLTYTNRFREALE